MNDVTMFQVSRVPPEVDAVLLVVGANDVPNTTDPAIFSEQYGASNVRPTTSSVVHLSLFHEKMR